MDKGKSAEVSGQDDKQDESSSGCGSEKTGEIILPTEKQGLDLGSSFGGAAGEIKENMVAADGVIEITEQKEHLQSDDELMSNAAAATKDKDQENGTVTIISSNENASLTSPGGVLESKGESTKSSDPNLLSYLGLVKNGSEGKPNQAIAVELSPSVPNNPGDEEQSRQNGKCSTDSPGQTSKPSSRQTPKPVKVTPDVSVKVATFSGGKDGSKPVDQIPGGSGGISEDQPTNQTSITPPRFIKLNLDQNKETIICCPVALLLQHKDYVDVTLQEDHKDKYSIKCCKCFHEDSEPYAMLEHLYEAHQLQGDLDKLLNLNSQHLGCMSHPECVNIPGVPTLPEGLSDLDNGVIRFNSMGIPRRSFACRLCPLNFTTSRGLLAHHQYFTRSVLTKQSKDPSNSTFLCKVCPRQFASFLDFYAHHKWMRVNKELFAKEKKVNIMNNSGEVVASVSAAMLLNEKTPSTTKFIWGFEANLTAEKNVKGYSIQSFPKTVTGPSDSCADAELNTGADNAKSLSEIQYVESSISYLPGKQGNEEAKFGCGICLKTFPRLVQLQGHMGSHAKKQNPVSTTTYIVPVVEEPKDIEYKCGICSEIFTKLYLLQNHMEGHCKPLKQKHLPAVSPFQTDTGSFSETVTLISYACDICNRTFLSEVKLWDHRLTHGPEAANKNTVLPSKKTDINRKKNHTCSVCKRSYYHKKSLNFHQTKGPCKMKVPVFLAVQNAIQPVKKLEKHLPAAGEAKGKVETRRKDGGNIASSSSLKGQAEQNEEGVQSKDGQDFPPPHDCDGCGKSFNLLWQLQRHKGLRPKANRYQIQQDADVAGMVIPKAPHSCNVCHQRFTCFWQLKCHKGKRHGQLSKWLARTGVKSLTVKMQMLAEGAGSSQDESNKNAGNNVTDGKSAKANRLQRVLAACRRSRVKYYNTRAQKKKFQSKELTTTNISPVPQYKCNICSKSFARKTSLRSHKVSHKRKMKNKSQEAVSQLTDESGKQISSAETVEDVDTSDVKRQELSECTPQSGEDSCSEKNSVTSEIDHKNDKLDSNVAASTETEQEILPVAPGVKMETSLQKASEETTCNEMDIQSSTDNTKPDSPEANESHINNAGESDESQINKSGDSEKDQSHKAELESSRRISSDEQEPQTSSEKNPSENNKTVSSGEELNDKIDSQPLRQIVRDLIRHQFSSKNPSQSYVLEKQHSENVSSHKRKPEILATSHDEVSSYDNLGKVLLEGNPVKAVNSHNSLSNTSIEQVKQQPKKNPVEAVNSQKSQSNTSIEEMMKQQPRKNPVEAVNSKTSLPNTSIEEMKQQPKKNPVEAVNSQTSLSNTSIKETKQQPKKSPVEAVNSQTSLSNTSIEETKQQPKKNPVEAVNSQTSLSNTSIEETKQQPKKNPVEAVNSQTSLSNTSIEEMKQQPKKNPVEAVNSQTCLSNTSIEEMKQQPKKNPVEAVNSQTSLSNTSIEEMEQQPKKSPVEAVNSQTSLSNTSIEEMKQQPKKSPVEAVNSQTSLSNTSIEKMKQQPKKSPVEAVNSQKSLSNTSIEEMRQQPKKSPVEAVNSQKSLSNTSIEEMKQQPKKNPVEAVNSQTSLSNTSIEEMKQQPKKSPVEAVNSQKSLSNTSIEEMKQQPKKNPVEAVNSQTSLSNTSIEEMKQQPIKNPVEAVNSQKSLSNTSIKETKQLPQNTTADLNLTSMEVTPDKNNLQLSGENKTDFHSTGEDVSEQPGIKSSELLSDEMDSPSSEKNLSKGANIRPLEKGLSDNSSEKTLHTYCSDITEPSTMEVETSDKIVPRYSGYTGISMEGPLENPHVEETVVDNSDHQTQTGFPSDEPNYQSILHRNNSNNQCVVGSSNNSDSKSVEEGVNANFSAVSSETGNVTTTKESTTTLTTSVSVPNLQSDKTVNQDSEGSEATIQDKFVKTETSDVFTCKVCSKTYAKFNQLNAHKRCHERKRRKNKSYKPKSYIPTKNGAAKFTCDICGVSFVEYRSLIGHKGAHASHRNLTGFKNRPTTENESSKEIQSDAVDAKDTNPQVQSQTNKTSDGMTQNSLELQEESQQQSKSLVTNPSANFPASDKEIDLQKAASKVAMVTSSSFKKLGKYSCEQCSKKFSRFTQLKCHMISHSSAKQPGLKTEKPYFCKVCKLKFITARRLLLHMKKHGNEKECELLRQKMALQDTDHSYYKKVLDESGNKTASEKNTVQQQKEKEETAKEKGNTTWSFVDFESQAYRVLSCPYCAKTYAKQCHLSNHMNVHKNYKCTLCGASFCSPRQLSCHFACHRESTKQNDDTKTTQDSGVMPNTVPVSLSGKPTDSIPVSGSAPRLACNLSSVILKKIFRVFLSGLKHKRKRAVNQRSKWFQPKRSLQRAAMKCHLARLQMILGALRKAVIMEIEADTHKVVYDCTECRKSSFCHKAMLRHFLDKHLPQTEEKKEKPSPEIGEERASAHQRFRNCPICKGSSGFQCHLHNTAEHIDLECKTIEKKGKFSCDQCNQKFNQQNKLIQHKKSHKVNKEEPTIACRFCSYAATSRYAMAAHLRIHKKRHSKFFKSNTKGMMQLGKAAKIVTMPRVDPRGCYTCRTCGKYYHSVKAFSNHTLEHEAKGNPNVQHGNSSNSNENSSNPHLQHDHSRNLNSSPSPKQVNTRNPVLQNRGSRNLTLQHGNNNNPTNTPRMRCGNNSNPTVQHEDNTTPNLQNGNRSMQHADYTSPTVQPVDTSNRTLQNEKNNMTRRKKRKHTLFKQDGVSLPFTCAQCTDAFKTADELWDHITKEHTSKNPYSCTKCAFSTDSPFSLQRHQKKHPETSLNRRKWHTYLKEVLHSNFTPSAGLPNSPTKVMIQSRESGKSQSDTVSPNKMVVPEVERQLGFAETVKSPRPEVRVMKTVSPQLPAGYDILQNSEGSSWMSVDSPDEYFACSQCKDFRASTQQEWDQHIEMVHKGNTTNKLSCKMCQYTTTNKERLERHVKLHRRMTLQCDSCQYRTPQRHQMIRHVQTVHKQQKPFKCKTCSYSTAYNHHLRRHVEKHKNPNFRCRYRKFMKSGDWHTVETSKGNACVICKECGCELRNKKTLRRHQIKKHFRITGAAQPGTLGPSTDVQKSFSVIQPQSVNSEQPQPMDVLAEKRSESYQCSVCSMVFKRRCDLNQHAAKGHPKTGTSLPSQCPQCGLLTGGGQLEDHMKVHEEENLLSCKEEGCQFKTAELVYLQRHQTKHAAQREALNTCRPCQMTFPDPSSLEVHNQQHHSKLMYNISVKDPFLCSHCPYRSPCEKDANRHWKLHNYNLPFKCEYCVFSTSTAAAIATHRKIHSHGRRNSSTAFVSKRGSKNRKMRSTGNEGSPQSGKIGLPSLPQHVFMSSQGKKLYECRYCQRFFEVAEAWQRHELRHMAEWPQY